MHDRKLLGPANVSDQTLTQLIAELLHEPPERVTLVSADVELVAYDIPAITTAGRYWVHGHAMVAGEPQRYSFFVKHVQSWSRSPLFTQVPEELAAMAEASVPWRIEPLVYRSNLGQILPHGLRMPRALGVFDLDAKSASIWLEQIRTVPAIWDVDRYSQAAYLLGRLAANPRVRERANVGEFPWTVLDYVQGRLQNQVIPLLRDSGLWCHPLVSGAFNDSLRIRLQESANRVHELVDELIALPLGTVHGDACPNNLLVTADEEGFVLIDYGFFGEGPVGFDLGQLLVGEIQLGRQGVPSLETIDEAILPSYVDGLRAEGSEISLDTVRRAHALHLMLYTGLSTVPFEHLGEATTPALQQLSADRAAIARFSISLLDATETTSGGELCLDV